MKTYDFVAIGGGNAGRTAASRVRAAGRRVALVDRGPIGGLCSLNGCNPKKVLYRSSQLLDEARHLAPFGIEAGEPRMDWNRVIDRKESFTRSVTPAAEQSLREQGIDLLRGEPRFVTHDTLEVDGTPVQAGGFVVATGSTPRPLNFPGADLAGTSDDILAQRKVPARLAIIGAGAVAMEFSQIFARAGSRVDVFAQGDRALRGMDAGLVDTMLETAARIGVRVHFKTCARAIRRESGALRLEYEAEGKGQAAEAEFVLNATGRIPLIEGLALDKADVATDERGVVVNDYLRSESNPRVFAAGDVHGRLQLSPVASYEGRAAARNFLEGDVEPTRYDSIPQVVFTLPQLAGVGLTEEAARERGLDVTVVENDMTDWKVYAIAGQGEARARVVLERGSERLLGAHLYAPEAGETIAIYALALSAGISTEDLRHFVFCYPTFASTVPNTLG